ncbi:MAG: class I SAM-dependent methyltransferase [Candidatus Hodarchaeales archaeon]|jgi:2-polyprenyl-3-methyl-5-hydroxy-6-metoxy-1,4-benzoquinol methylase
MELQPDLTCFYCNKIREYDVDYPPRVGKFTTDQTALRCAIHSQFQCSTCKKYHHFSWIYWCQKEQKIICGDCNSPTLKPVGFWGTTYTYSFYCSVCETEHYDLYYSEFQGNHPWQKKKKHHLMAIIDQKSEEESWIPKEFRDGKEIQLEEALTIPDSALAVRKTRARGTGGTLKFHTPLIHQEKINQEDVQHQWEQNSNQWIKLIDEISQDDQGDLNRQLIIDPAMWELIGEVKGLNVLDAGCGNGYFSRILAQRGANVTGVDHSRVFIDHCQKVEEEYKQGIQYFAEGLENLTSVRTESIDLIVSNIVFVDVLDYKSALKELARVLKPTGKFIWSNLHPVFGRISNLFYRVPMDTPRNEERLYVIIDRYFDSGGTKISWGTMKPIWQFDRTLSEYTSALKEAGFVIREIVEPKPSNENIKAYPRFLAFDTDRIPLFIIFECQKYSK